MKIGSGRFYSGTTGAERRYVFPIQSWGLQVKDLFSAVVASGRSSTHAQIKLQLNLSANGDENALVSGNAPISGATNVNGTLPQTLSGQSQSMTYPYFQIVLAVLGDNSAEEYVDCEIFVGGKQY